MYGVFIDLILIFWQTIKKIKEARKCDLSKKNSKYIWKSIKRNFNSRKRD